MYQLLLPIHSIVRWLLLAGLSYSLFQGIRGIVAGSAYSRADNFFRSFTSGMSHLQLLVGMVLYFKSPMAAFFRKDVREALKYPEAVFFGAYHITMMIAAVVLITIGASRAKREQADHKKHRVIAWWFGLALVLIFLAIPWPFNPYAARPLWRTP